jgi:Fe-S-cluster containining protein
MHTRGMLSLFDSFLSALCDPEGGDALYGMHTTDAIVRCGTGIGPAAETDRASFTLAHREISLRGREVLPQFRRAALLHAPADLGVYESVAWFEVTETREHRSLVAALGLRTIEGAQQIGWCTFAKGVERWSYKEGLLQSLADYPWMRKAEPAQARALLDASYFRRYWRAPTKFTTLPDARFSCQMSTACCKHDFEITLPPEAQLVIDAMPWETVQPQLSGTRLRVRADGKLQLKELSETCRFLSGRGRCLVHQTLGRQPFEPCSVFPFAFAQTPEGIAIALSPICGSTRRGIGVAVEDREDDLRERLGQTEPRQANGFRLGSGAEISWERFRDIERALCEVLATDELPLRRRLYVGTRLLGALHSNEPLDMNGWINEPPVEITSDLREAIRGMLAKILTWDRTALRLLPPAIPSGLFELEAREPSIVVRILQNALFSKVYSYPYDLTTAHNFLIVLYLLTLIMQAGSNGPLSDVMWQELGSLGVHGLLRSVLHDGVPEGFRTLFGTAEFGQWMLAA